MIDPFTSAIPVKNNNKGKMLGDINEENLLKVQFAIYESASRPNNHLRKLFHH